MTCSVIAKIKNTGSHTIALHYFPKGLIAGVIVSILSLLLFIVLYYITHLRSRSIFKTSRISSNGLSRNCGIPVRTMTKTCFTATGSRRSYTCFPKQSTPSDVTVLGEGSTNFAFTVVDLEGNTTAFEIHTDKDTVGSALLELFDIPA